MEVLASVQYEKLEQIGVGQGRNSLVFKARDRLGRIVAVKELAMADLDAQGLSDYYQEAKSLFAAQHDNVVPIHYACETDTHVGLVMPLFAKGCLADRITAGPLRLREVVRVAHGMLHGLARIHIANLVHFDVKPSNVLFSDRDEPMVADFGQARLMDAAGTAPAPRIYPWCFPPEAFVQGVGIVESDIYQVGLTLYRAVNGDPYFRDQLADLGTDEAIRDAIELGSLVDRDRFMPHVPNGLRRVIRRALHPECTERYHSATEMADALASVALPHDWVVSSDGATLSWHCEPAGRTHLVVIMTPCHQAGRWAVEVYTDGKGGRRKKEPGRFWKAGLTSLQAERHLRGVFTSL